MPALPTLLCPQICALLFASLYILCHFIITHFKKHTDFTGGKRAARAALTATFSLPRVLPVPPLLLTSPGALVLPQPGCCDTLGGSKAQIPQEDFCSIWRGENLGREQGAMLQAAPPPTALWFGILSPQFMMTRMLLSTELRKFLLVPFPESSSSARTLCPVGAGDAGWQSRAVTPRGALTQMLVPWAGWGSVPSPWLWHWVPSSSCPSPSSATRCCSPSPRTTTSSG